MKFLNSQSQNVVVNWISFNIKGLPDPLIIARRLSKHFTSHVLMDYVPSIGFHGFKKKYKVSIRQYTGSKSHWVGTQKLDLGTLMMDQHTLSLGRIDLYFSRTNSPNDTIK